MMGHGIVHSVLLPTVVVAGCAKTPGIEHCDGSGMVVLEPQIIKAFPSSVAPRSIVSRNVKEVLALDSSGRALVFVENDDVSTAKTRLDHDLIAVGTDGVSYFAATTQGVHELQESPIRISDFPSLTIEGAKIKSIAGAPGKLWLVTATDTSTQIVQFGKDPLGRYRRLRSEMLPGDAQLHPHNGHIIAALTAAPYTIYEFDEKLKTVAMFSIARDPQFRARTRASPSLFSLAIVPLDCNQLLQTFVDARSGGRVFAVIDARSGRLLRSNASVRPIGIVQAIAGSNELLGAIERPGGRSVLRFRWKRDALFKTQSRGKP
jgi:hypothetical protein